MVVGLVLCIRQIINLPEPEALPRKEGDHSLGSVLAASC